MKSIHPLFDVHTHLTHPDFPLEVRPLLLKEAFDAGVEKVMIVATDEKSLDDALDLQDQFGMDKIAISASLTPHDVSSDEDPFFYEVKKQAVEHRLSAIGETGLEYFYCKETAHFQKNALRRYIDLSLEVELPLQIHCRDAFSDLISILSEYQKEKRLPRGMVHCFSGTQEEAHELIKLGFSLSFSGIITFPKSKALQEIAASIPLHQLLVETDSPYLAPKQKRGKENHPAYLVYVVECLSEILDLPYEAVADATYTNSKKLFGYEK